MRMVNLFENIKKDNKGVSMVTLVITIIVILILSAATFVSSIKTIEKTSYSKYISNISDVNSAFEESSAIVKGKKVMEDKTKEMNQIYNYVARNGDEEKDFLKVNEVPKYTIVRNGEILGIDLPEMIVESGTGKKVPVKYATTAQGKIFTWPPLDYDNKLYITDVDTVEHKMQTQLKVGEEEFEIKINPEDGTLLDWMVFPEDDGQVQIPTNPSGEGGGSGLDHTHVFTSKTQTEEYFCSEATCTTQMKYYYKCESCDAKGANTYGVGMPLGHLNGEETLVKEANCTEQGIVQNRCSRCETLVTSYKPLNSSNHHGGEEEEITKRSTCKEKGEKTYKCKSCKEVLRTESLELAEHNVDDFEISKEPTCTEKGIKTYFCSVCNQEMKTEEIPTLDHNEENVVTTKEPTCIEKGTKKYSCSNCNQEVKTVDIEALGHEHSKSEVTKEATCKEKGVRTKQCIRCTDTITEEIPIDTIKHYGTEETKETKKATCTETGVKETICSLCKKVLQSETIAALGHDWNVPERPRKCNRCGLEENLTAQAVYTSDDKTLTFIREFEIYETGDTFNGKTVASAYIGIEQENYTRGWESISGDVKSVVFRDEIKPKTLKKWFYGFSNCENMDIAKLNTENVTNMHSMFADCRKLTTLDVSHFKTDNVTDMLSMFNSCSNVEILDVSNFNTENVTEMAYMFWGCNNLTALDVSKFKTAKVISLDCMFRECKTLKTLDVSNFDTSLVISMGSMFSGCTSLETLDVSNFNTEKVTDFSYMFLQCQQLKAIDVSGFKTSSAQSMAGMFNHCRNLEVIDVSNFNTEKVTDMENMFYLCENVKVLDLSNWKTDLVTDMNEMFTCCYKVKKLDLSGFSTEKVTDMHNIFQACRSLEEVTLGPKFEFKDNAQNEGNQYLPAPQDVYIPGATGHWYDISHFKEYAPEEIPNNYAATYVAIKQEAILAANSTWYSQGGTEISRNQISSIDIVDFYDVTGKTIVDQWDASINIINTNDPQGPITAYIEDDGLGNNTYKLTLSGNNSGKIYANEDSSYVFSDKAETDYFTSLTNLNNAQLLDTSKVTTMQTMFSYAGNTADSFILSGIEQWNTKLNKSFYHMFDNAGTAAKTFDIGDLSGWDTSNVTTMAAMFRFSGTNADTFDIGNLSGWDTSKVTAMNAMFNHTGCEASIYNIGDLSNWDTSSVTTMGYMFSYAGNKAKVIDIGDLSTKTVQKADGSSYVAWDTSKVSSMHGMFEGSYHNTESFDIGNLGSWNTSNVNGMAKMFTNTAVYSEEVNIGDLSGWDTSSVTDMSYMFYQFANHECDSLNLGNLGTWDTSSVTNMSHMFYEPAFYAEYFYIGDLSNWDTSNVTDMSSMFSGLGANKTSLIDIGDLSTKTVQKSDGSSYIAWDTSKVTNMSRMFYWVNHEVIGKADFDDLSNWDTSSVTDMSYMFFLAGSLESLDISGWDTSSVTSMTGMFQECYELNTIYVSDGWSTVSLDMDAIYSDGTAANGDMFRYSSKLVGGNGTAYATNHLEYLEDEDGLHPNEDKVDDTAYAIIDGKDGKLGYLTNNVHLTYEDVEVGFIVAPQLIIKSKVFTSADSIKYEFADTESSTYASINETTGEITGIAAGTAKVKVTITNAKGQTISAETDVTVSANYTYNVVYKSASGLDLGGTTVTNKNGTTNTITAPQITGYNTPESQSVTWDTETKTITFTYSPTSYNITINCNGGSGVSHIIYNIETETFTIGTPTREGYTFVGWTDVDGVTHETVTIEKGSTGARNYTAKWENNDIAQAIYSATDNSLTFIKNVPQTVGEKYNGKTITAVYTGFEKEIYDETNIVPWSNYASSINSVYFENEIKPISTAFWFEGMTSCTTLNLTNLDTSNITDMTKMFFNCKELTTLEIGNWNTANVTSFRMMFSDNGLGSMKLQQLDVSNWDTSSATDMQGMFEGCGQLISLDLSKWNVEKVKDMSYMFGDCTNITDINISGWNTSSCQTFNGMFNDCENITTINTNELDLDSCTDIAQIFEGCLKLETLDLSEWNMSKVESSYEMFDRCYLLEEVKLGAGFKFIGTTGYLPKPSNEYITGADGKWYDIETGIGYDPVNVHKNANKTVTYVATNQSYSISYNLNGGTLTSGNPTSYKKYDSDITLGTPTREGYTFVGWTGSNGNEPQTTVTISKGSTGDKTYSANWLANTYEVRYNANGGSGAMSNSTHVYDFVKSLSENTFTRNGYTFEGWAITANGAVAYNDKATVSNLTSENAGIINLYAVWNPTSYNITIDCNGGSGVTHMSYTIETPTFTIGTPTRSGYTFVGWTGSNGNTPQISISITKGSIGAKSYIANWKINKKYIYDSGNTYNSDVGQWMAVQSASSNSSYANALTFNSDHMTIISRGNEYDGGVATSWALDLSGYTKLKAVVLTEGVSAMYVVKYGQLSGFNTHTLAQVSLGEGWQEVTIDISSINQGHVAFYVGGDISRAGHIYSVWLE